MHDVVAAADDGILVPVLVLVVAGFDEFVLVGYLADDVLFAVFINDHDVADRNEPAAGSFFVEEADGALGFHDVGLVAADDPLAEFFAAVLDAAIVVVEAELDLEDEVFGLAVLPDEEGVALGGILGGGLAADDAVGDGPESRVAVPAGEVFAVEDGFEAVIGGCGRCGRDAADSDGGQNQNHH